MLKMHIMRKMIVKRTFFPFVLAVALAGCGGGGSGDVVTVVAPASTALRDFTAASTLAFVSYKSLSIAPADLVAVATLPASSGPTFVKIWFDDPDAGSTVLFLGRWSSLTTGTHFDVPAGIRSVQYQAYNENGSVSGSIQP